MEDRDKTCETELDSYIKSKNLLEELFHTYVSSQPDCRTCENYILKLSCHIRSYHAHEETLAWESSTGTEKFNIRSDDSKGGLNYGLRVRKRVKYADIEMKKEERYQNPDIENDIQNIPKNKSVIEQILPTPIGNLNLDVSSSLFSVDGFLSENVENEIMNSMKIEIEEFVNPEVNFLDEDITIQECANQELCKAESEVRKPSAKCDPKDDPDFSEGDMDPDYIEHNDDSESDDDPDYNSKNKTRLRSNKRKSSNSEPKSNSTSKLFNKIHSCDICPRSYTYSRDLTSHYRTVHSDSNPKSSRIHNKIHSCDFCPKSYTHARDLVSHYRTTHKDKTETPYKCHVCEKKFFSSLQLKRHVADRHPGTKPYLCKYCDKGFESESEYQRHIETHQVDANVEKPKLKPLICSTCNKCFPTNHSLSRHKVIHTGENPYICEQCGKGFRTTKNFTSHMKNHTAIGQKQKREKNFHKVHSCNLCPKSYTHTRDLITHRRRVHHDKIRPPYVCHVCEKKVFSNLQLKRHMKAEHPDQKPYKCAFCGRGFLKESIYLIHLQSHDGVDKTFKCEICGRGFSRKKNYLGHQKVHTGEKPFTCECCGGSYGTADYLQIHMRGHTGEKPYMCDKCSACFTGKTALNRHMQTHRHEIQ